MIFRAWHPSQSCVWRWWESEGDAGRRGAAPSSEGLLYMNYDDAAAPTAVISLWIRSALFAHWWKAHPTRLHGNASGGLFYSFIDIQLCTLREARCTNCNILPETELSRVSERPRRTFGMQIRQTVVCKRTYATHAA